VVDYSKVSLGSLVQIDWTIAPPEVNRTPSSISPFVTPEAAKIISLPLAKSSSVWFYLCQRPPL
jgi:hypothetical protein